jgi:hypothetical protein
MLHFVKDLSVVVDLLRAYRQTNRGVLIDAAQNCDRTYRKQATSDETSLYCMVSERARNATAQRTKHV